MTDITTNHMTRREMARGALRVGALLAAGLLLPGGARRADAATPSLAPDASVEAALVIHKYRLPDGVSPGTPADGSDAAGGVPDQAKPLDGIPFAIRRAYSQGEADALVSQGEANASEFSAIQEMEGYLTRSGEEDVAGTTDDKGTLTFDLTGKLGTYLVTEGYDERVEMRTKPFLASVPMPDPKNPSEWLYTVHVYPKNYLLDVDKCIIGTDSEHLSETSSATGEPITYHIEADVPEDVGDYLSYVVEDLLDWRLYVDEDLEGSCSVRVGSTELLPGADYAVTVTQDWEDDYHDRHLVQWDLSPARGKLQEAVRGASAGKVRVVIEFVARLVPDAVSGTVLNGGRLVLVNESGQHSVESPKTLVSFGAIRVTKTAAGSDGKLLKGAAFRIARSREDAVRGRWMDRLAADGTNEGVWEEVTDGEGVATFGGLAFELKGDTRYWLVEVTPPDGYQPLHEPIEVLVGPNAQTDGKTPYMSTVQVVNAPVADLPGTGGTGTVLPAVGAVAVAAGVAAAAGTAVRASRRGR